MAAVRMDEVGLTVRERAVLAAAVTSPGDAAVAEALGLTPVAVHSSLVAIKTKLGARSKLEAVVIALRHGLIDLPQDPAGSAERPRGGLHAES
jgi:DNA-binding NarL/FixJ family response regulator